ncbi:uncharacterized protein LOC132753447 [Ruditapes philippinarum]|uniref:uncharacterized protein LOC132753447 n=1 Tax=Ruditapes philippinarum TaxID=129788 RepID=UPI00295AF380|nr:uncharacterized protein LOC132753447 [Ruditapes philippinarum]
MFVDNIYIKSKMEGGSNVGTLLQRRRKPVKIGKEETLLILRAYCSHPTNWSDVLDEVRQNLDQLPEDARALYHSGNLRQLRDRMSGKLSKITKMRVESIQDSDIRGVAMQIDAMERRLQNTGVDTRQNEASQIESQTNQENQPGTSADLRESIANALSSSQEEDPTPPSTQRRRRRKRPLADIIRENQLLYNDFIKNKVSRLLRQLGVETSSDDSN